MLFMPQSLSQWFLRFSSCQSCCHLVLLRQHNSRVVAFFWLLLVCCNASSNIDSVSPLLVLLMVSISAKIWRYGLWPLTWVALRRVFHVFMSQSNTRSDRVFWNYIVNMFSVLIRKIGGDTGFSFCSICLHRCGGKNFSNTTSRSWVVGEKNVIL